jgi:hypothetical protein
VSAGGSPGILSLRAGTVRFAMHPCTSSSGSPQPNSSLSQKEPLLAMTLPDRGTNMTTAARWPACLLDVCLPLRMNPICLPRNLFARPSLRSDSQTPPPNRLLPVHHNLASGYCGHRKPIATNIPAPVSGPLHTTLLEALSVHS